MFRCGLTDRCGCGQDLESYPDEKSPVFLQFLEVVYQFLLQFPDEFEFSDELLVFLAVHVVSGQFGTFLGNSDKERRTMYESMTSTRSVWAHVLQFKSQFQNMSFVNTVEVLWPSVSVHRIKLWERYWLKWDISSHPRSRTSNTQGWVDPWQ
jgi:hypothetical protein